MYLIRLSITCANHVAYGSLENANTTLEQISQLAIPDEDTMQRIAAYFTEALTDRIHKTWPGLHRGLNSTRIIMLFEEIMVQKFFFELFPYLKVAYILTDQAIVESMEGEKMVHIIEILFCSYIPFWPWMMNHLQKAMLMNQNTSLGDLFEKDMVNGYSPSPNSTSSSKSHGCNGAGLESKQFDSDGETT